MRDPVDGGTDFERQLLEAGRREPVAPAWKRRMARALDELGAAAISGGAARISTWPARLALPTLVAVFGLGALGWYLQAPAPAPRSVATASAAAPAALSPAPPLATAVVASVQQAPLLARPAAVARAGSDQQPSAAADDGLGKEIALLDQARGALRDHADVRALSILERYHRRFTRGALRPEADALTIEAFLQRGDKARAAQLARRFASSYPQHPLEARVQGFLRAATASDPP